MTTKSPMTEVQVEAPGRKRAFSAGTDVPVRFRMSDQSSMTPDRYTIRP